MKRLKLLAMMLALGALMAGVVIFASPYAPAVEPTSEIETIWAIEDAREESDKPLVTRLYNNGVPMAYDASENTFYCPLDLTEGDEWPAIHLTAPQGSGVRMIFVDDYAYDSCAEALREGYSYEAMAYNGGRYSYFNIVFTGMMQLHMTAQEPFTEADTPVEVTFSQGQQTMHSYARAHLRGGVTLHGPKKAYRIELTRKRNGTGKTFAEVPHMGSVQNLNLLPMPLDDTFMRDRLAWDLYGQMRTGEDSYGARRMRYVELYVNGGYEGLYLMMEPFDHAAELGKISPSGPSVCGVYRTGSVEADKDRPGKLGAYNEGYGYELHYEPAGAAQFAALEDFIALCKEEDDAAFAARAMQIVDVDSMLHYFLVLQASAMIDNVFNNFFVIAQPAGGGYRYSFAPWDMDMSWGTPGHPHEMWVYFPPMDRLLNLNAGNVRARMLQMWRQMRETVFTAENVEAHVNHYMHLINDSGAAARNAARWDKENYSVDGYSIVTFAAYRFDLLDQVFAEIAETEGPMALFEYDDYGNKYGTMKGVGP